MASVVRPVNDLMPGSVLIVDDDRSVVESLRKVLPPNVEVSSATNAAAANALLDRQEFSGLVLDVVLNDGNGFDVLHHMRTRRLIIPTVVVSGKLPSYLREMLNEEQVKLVFPKPVEPRLLAAVVLGLCGM
jgi:NtrC-family two-component system response regulator AlgB